MILELIFYMELELELRNFHYFSKRASSIPFPGLAPRSNSVPLKFLELERNGTELNQCSQCTDSTPASLPQLYVLSC